MTIEKEIPKILIAEDEVLIATDLANSLKSMGYSVCAQATSGEKALELLDQHKPDLVMMDIVLQGKMDGIDVAELIHDKWGIPVIFLTAYADQDKLERAKQTYPFGYVLKPFRDQELKVTTEMALFVASVEEDRKKAEKELCRSENKYRCVAENSPVGIVVIQESRIAYANPVARNFLGCPDYQDANLSFIDFIHSEDRDSVYKRYLDRAAGDKSQLGYSFRAFDQDGNIHWIESNSNLIEWDENPAVLTFLTDICKEKGALDALRKSEERFRTIFENTQVGIFQVSSDSRILNVNPATCNILGYKKEELIGKYTPDITHPDDRKRNRQLRDELFTGKSNHVQFEKRYIHKDGSIIHSILSMNMVRDENGQPAYTLGTITDITDRKKLENQLLHKQMMLEKTEKIAKTGSWHWDIASDTVTWSNELFRIFQISPSIKAPPISEQSKLIHADDLTKLTECIKRTSTTQIPYELEVRVFQNDGEIATCLARGFPETDNAGKVTSLYGSFQDITEKKQAEIEKERLQAQLLQAHKMEAVGVLAGGIAHEFNNLLQAINGHSQLLLLDKNTGDRDYSSLSTIKKTSDRAADLVKQLLQFSRKDAPEMQPVNLNQIISESAKILRRDTPAPINYDIRTDSSVWEINADRLHISRAILNLGKNAVDSMKDGGTILIETKNVTLDKAYSNGNLGAKPGRYALLSITDTGHGMDEKTVNHIFEPFFTTKGVGNGTGLGLPTVYGIVKSHEGYIKCYSEIGQGTKFNMYFPAIEQLAIDYDEPVVEKQFQGGNETILVVDNDSTNRNYTAHVLKRYGYSVITASSGEEALGIYITRSAPIDLVIMDLVMPGIGGHRAMLELHKTDPRIKVIIASGYSKSGQVQESMDSGAIGYLGKPYQISDLLNTVRNALNDGGLEH